MSLTLDIGATGMLAQQLNVDTIANNIANMTTTGFKRQRAEFQDLLYQTKLRAGATSSDSSTLIPSGIQQGLGVKAGALYRINEQGAIKSTSNQYDLAIKGKGFFEITMPSGDTAYTRDGSFQLSSTGELVNSQGFTVQPSITIPSDAIDVTIDESGQVLVKIQGQIALSNVGQLQLARFPNESGLSAMGNNMFIETEGSGAAIVGNPASIGYGGIQQAFLETSNVNVVEEITSLIQAQRAYEMNSKVIQTGDQMLNIVTQMR